MLGPGRMIPTIEVVSRRTVEVLPAPRNAIPGESLLRLAMSRPREAVERGQQVLSSRPNDVDASYVLQSLSVAHRELSDGPTALRFARRALRAAQRSGRADRIADVRATLGATLAVVGRNRDALQALDAAIPDASGADAARIRVRRGGVLQILGRDDDALADLRRAIPVLRAAGDVVYEARALNWRALVYDDLGQHARSDRDLARSEELFRQAGQQLESVWARHNRGHLAFRSGDFPSALRHYDAAEQMYAELGEREAELELDRCRLLLAAGMPDDARAHARDAVNILASLTAGANAHAEALLTAASAGLAAGDVETSRSDAEASARLFRGQHRDRWVLRAQRTALAARWMSGERSALMLRSAGEVAERLEHLRDPEASDGRLLAGRIALALGSSDDAHRHLEAAAKARHRGAAISKATGWLARALQAEAAGDSRTMLASCRRGLDVLDEHRLTMGATEMRARASVHGAELAALATRHAARAGDPKQLLLWSERWRATALAVAPVRPPDDDELANELSALRGVTRRITELQAEGASTVRPREGAGQARGVGARPDAAHERHQRADERAGRRTPDPRCSRHHHPRRAGRGRRDAARRHGRTRRHPAAGGRVGGQGGGRAGLRALWPAPRGDVHQRRGSSAGDVVARDQRRLAAGGAARAGGRAPRRRRDRHHPVRSAARGAVVAAARAARPHRHRRPVGRQLVARDVDTEAAPRQGRPGRRSGSRDRRRRGARRRGTAIPAPTSSPATPRRRRACWPRSRVRRWRTSPRTARSGPTTRCSAPCGWRTAS